jgi:hypothetical protein
LVFSLAALAIAMCATPAHAQLFWQLRLSSYWLSTYDDDPWHEQAVLNAFDDEFDLEILAKAQPDECFAGIRAMGDLTPPSPPPCGEGQPKVNEAYVWGLTKADSGLWFGTCANVHALVLGGYLGNTNPVQTASYVAEFGYSFYAQALGLPPQVGDWRPPKIYAYDLETGTLANKLPFMPPSAHLLLQRCTGIRSAGTGRPSTAPDQPVALLAGPSLLGGINMFAFDHNSGAFIAATNLLAYSNIRKWREHEGVLYTTVANTLGGGSVLRWNSDPAAPGYPFAFETVGILNAPGAELAVHEGRLFVSTWPGNEASTLDQLAGLWMSPVIPENGLTVAHAGLWQKAWQVDEYEPDPVVAATYGGGALASFDGWLYWGTMHVPLLALGAHSAVYGEPQGDDLVWAFFGTYRPISIFRGKDFGSPEKDVQLVYGLDELPVYNPTWNSWDLTDNNMGGAHGRMGIAGFGNFFNNYTWTMEVFDNELYIGTMDWSYLAQEGLDSPLLGDLNPDFFTQILLNSFLDMAHHPGADLHRIPAGGGNGAPVRRDGMNNYSTYGIRTMALDEDNLYLGMANPMNLMTDPDDDKPEGGWELLRLSKLVPCPNDSDCDGLPDDWEDEYYDGPTNADPTADDDGDGFDNFAECLANTNPTDSNSYWQTYMEADGAAGMRFQWMSHTGRLYRLYRTTNLFPATWHPVDDMVGDGNLQGFTNQPGPANTAYFRIGISRTQAP